MTIKECFDFVDEVKPNYFSNERKLQWINEVEGLVQTKVLLIAPEDVISYTIDGIDTKVMFALPPHDNIYPVYLSAMIDFWNGEYDRYANTKQMFDERFSEYSRFIAATPTVFKAGPSKHTIRNRDLMATPPYYISAYGIWLKLGNQGTEQDFINSLQGADGEKTLIQYNGATGNLEWKHENEEIWSVLLSFTDIITQGEADVIAACVTYANTAQLHSEAAEGYADDAQGSASAASASATAADSSAASAANHANAASASATAAAGSASDAAGSATTATNRANEAAGYAATAQNSAAAASASASTAATQASSASNSATSASSSADSASGSATSASGYATAASTSAGEAAASAAAAEAAASGMLPTDYETLTNKPSIGGTPLSGALTLAALKIQAELVAGANITLTPLADGKTRISAAGGGGTGTSDYTELTNKPKINSVELSGNKSLADLGIASAAALAAKQDKLTAGTNITISGTTISATGVGEDGKSAYDLAVEQGFTGTLTEWLDSLNGAKGEKGDPGKDGAPGADGADGAKGEPGKDGYTPVKGIDYFDGAPGAKGADGKDGISATHSWSGTTLTVTSASGTSSANLKGEKGDQGVAGQDGKDGAQGVPGADGHTPEKGVDYFTAADKADIVNSVLAAIPVVGSEGY